MASLPALLSQAKRPFSRARALFAATAVSFAITLVALSSFAADNQLRKISEPIVLPQFELQDIDDKSYKLSDYSGKPLIVIFWASWCPPCLTETPSINRAWHKIKDEGIGLVAINAGEAEDQVIGFSLEYEAEFPLLVDSNNSTYNAWDVRGLPSAFVFNAHGEVVYQARGEVEWDDEGLLERVRALRL
ncbi:MAG: peroxiredoxin [Saprospiraceae bacterium]|jgi:peroxiredoxin